jgi:hypothetical protein
LRIERHSKVPQIANSVSAFELWTASADEQRDREKQAIEAKLARCHELARQYPGGETAQMIRDLEEELRQQLRAVEI